MILKKGENSFEFNNVVIKDLFSLQINFCDSVVYLTQVTLDTIIEAQNKAPDILGMPVYFYYCVEKYKTKFTFFPKASEDYEIQITLKGILDS